MSETSTIAGSPSFSSARKEFPPLRRGEGEWVFYARQLWRHRRGLFLVTFFSSVLGVGVAFLGPKVYLASAILEVGPTYDLVDSPEPLRLKVEEVYFPVVLNELGIRADIKPSISTAIPRGMKIVKVFVRTNRSGESLTILQRVIERALVDQKERLESLRREREMTLLKKEGEEKNLIFQSRMNDKSWEMDQKSLATALLVKNLELKTAGAKIELMERKKTLLKKDRELLEKQVATSGNRLQDLLKNRDRLNARAGEKDLLSVIRFSDDIQVNQTYHDSLEQRLTSSLEGDEINLISALDDLKDRQERLQIELQEDQLSQGRKRLAYENARGSYEKQINELKLDIQILSKSLENLRPIAVLVPPREKNSSAWPSKGRMAILSGGAGFSLAALFLVLRLKLMSLW